MDWISCDTREPQAKTPPPGQKAPRGVHIVQRRRAGAKQAPPAPRGNVERLEKIRRRKRMRNLRVGVVCAVLLAAVLAGFTGIYGASLALLGDLVDTVAIALTPGTGFPAPFTLPGFRNAQPLSGGFAAVGGQDLVLYSAGGRELRRLQHGYGRADITTGNTRVCIYNRGSRELRVESRSRTLFEQKFDDAVQLCAMSPNGTLAVFTKSRLTIYNPSFEEIYAFRTQDLPTALAACSDNKQFAAGCPYASGGALGGSVYLMHTGRDDYITIRNTEGLPLKLYYLSGSEILVVYDTYAAVYKTADGSELYRYGFAGRSLQSAAVGRDKTIALLFGDGVHSAATQLAILNAKLQETGSTAVRARCLGVAAGRNSAYVLTHEGVLCYKDDCTFEGLMRTENRPLAVLSGDTKPLVLTQGQVRTVDPRDTSAQEEPPKKEPSSVPDSAPSSVPEPASGAQPESGSPSEQPPEAGTDGA